MNELPPLSPEEGTRVFGHDAAFDVHGFERTARWALSSRRVHRTSWKAESVRSIDFTNVQFDGWSSQSMTFTDVSFTACKIESCQAIETRFVDVAFCDVHFSGCAFFDCLFQNCSFEKCTISRWDTEKCHFVRSQFNGGTLEGWNAKDSHLDEVSGESLRAKGWRMAACKLDSIEWIGGVINTVEFLDCEIDQFSVRDADVFRWSQIDGRCDHLALRSCSASELDFKLVRIGRILVDGCPLLNELSIVRGHLHELRIADSEIVSGLRVWSTDANVLHFERSGLSLPLFSELTLEALEFTEVRALCMSLQSVAVQQLSIINCTLGGLSRFVHCQIGSLSLADNTLVEEFSTELDGTQYGAGATTLEALRG